jgi:hypothetical protein
VGGTLTSSAAGVVRPLVLPGCLLLWGASGVERGRVGGVVVGTLLGPEGAGPRVGGLRRLLGASCGRVLRVSGCVGAGGVLSRSGAVLGLIPLAVRFGRLRVFGWGVGSGGVVAGGGRLLFENCTVDASIFK